MPGNIQTESQREGYVYLKHNGKFKAFKSMLGLPRIYINFGNSEEQKMNDFAICKVCAWTLTLESVCLSALLKKHASKSLC